MFESSSTLTRKTELPTDNSYNDVEAARFNRQQPVTVSSAPKGVTPLLFSKSAVGSNVLNSFRSYNYVFTLASLTSSALTRQEVPRENKEYFVIAKSGGKGTYSMQPSDTVKSNSISTNTINSFNNRSPGRFDFYINNVKLDTIMGFDRNTSLSVATKLEFDIVEPYSMTGFIEALQIASIASGHDQYLNTPFLLKMEFIGYPDADQLSDNCEIVPHATRYFVFSFTGIDINVDEKGASYSCKAVPHNERGFGIPAILKAPIKPIGNTVGSVLTSLVDGINESKVKDAELETDISNKDKHDSYFITFPTLTDTGLNYDIVNKEIFDISMGELHTSNSVWSFRDPASQDKTSLSPTISAYQFSEGSNIHECIVSVIRDSDYTANILRKLASSPGDIIDSNGMVPYFIVNIDVDEKSTINNTTFRPYYNYRYQIIPYKLHYTRIPLASTVNIDTSGKYQTASRRYDYLYTGNNVDIKTFQLKFNSLFFQAIPKALGNKSDLPGASTSISPPNVVNVGLAVSEPVTVTPGEIGKSPIQISQTTSGTITDGTLNAGLKQNDPYDALARNMHQAILENVDQCSADIEIIGDPFYLVTAGMRNSKQLTTVPGTTANGEATYTHRDILIILTFKNPIDIDEKTGQAVFGQGVVPYSGLFRVITVSSEFKDGVFSQRLSLIRVPGTLIPELEDPQPMITSVADSSQASTTEPVRAANTIKATTDSLLASITSGLNINGLPGTLSSLATGLNGSLGGAVASATNIGSQLNQLVGANNISSSIRLASAGLSSLSTNINSAGASIVQLTNQAHSLGVNTNSALSNLSNIATSAGESITNVGTSALSKINSLGADAAKLVSSVGSKIDLIKGNQTSLSTQLGIDVSKLSGLPSNIQTKLTTALSDAAKTIPAEVDLTSAVKSGLILNNIPLNGLANIPSTQPELIALAAEQNLQDIQMIVSSGGQLLNLNNVPTNISNLIDLQSVSLKLDSMQKGISTLVRSTQSVESAINNVKSIASASIPNVSGITNSVVSKFGSVSTGAANPLTTFMQNSVNKL